jgi:hypothetical protein
LELTHIVRKRFLGLPYLSIAAHSRHIQEGSQIQAGERRANDISGIPKMDQSNLSGRRE